MYTEALRPQAATEILPPPSFAREQLTHMEMLPPGEAVPIDTNADIYPPEVIGIKSDENGRRISVAAEIGIPGAQNSKTGVGFVALVREEYPDGEVMFRLRGLTVDSSGQATAVEGLRGVYLPPNGEMTIGRYTKRPNGAPMVSAADLWGAGAVFGGDTSREQVSFLTSGGNVSVKDLKSTNGTFIRPQEAANDPSGNNMRRTRAFAATPEAATEVLDLRNREKKAKAGGGVIRYANSPRT